MTCCLHWLLCKALKMPIIQGRTQLFRWILQFTCRWRSRDQTATAVPELLTEHQSAGRLSCKHSHKSQQIYVGFYKWVQYRPKKSSWLWLAWQCSLSKLHGWEAGLSARGCPSPTLQPHSSGKVTGGVKQGFPIWNGPGSYPEMINRRLWHVEALLPHPTAQSGCCPKKSKNEILDMIKISLHDFCPDSEISGQNITCLMLQQRKISPWHS